MFCYNRKFWCMQIISPHVWTKLYWEIKILWDYRVAVIVLLLLIWKVQFITWIAYYCQVCWHGSMQICNTLHRHVIALADPFLISMRNNANIYTQSEIYNMCINWSKLSSVRLELRKKNLDWRKLNICILRGSGCINGGRWFYIKCSSSNTTSLINSEH